MHPELAVYHRRFGAARDELARICAGLPKERFLQSPPGGGWSVSECVEHLCLAGELVLPRLEMAIEKARAEGGIHEGTFRYRWLERWFVRATGGESFPVKRRFSAPAVYTPGGGRDAEELLPRFSALQERYQAATESADGVHLSRVKVASPATRLLRLSLGLWFAGMAGHQERHLAQARAVIAALERGAA